MTTEKPTGAGEEMPCPKCGRMHARGDYVTWPADVEGNCYAAPPHVQCPCGLTLEHSVPLFAVDCYGWHWRPKQDSKQLRLIVNGAPAIYPLKKQP